jgi:hypothetical protein
MFQGVDVGENRVGRPAARSSSISRSAAQSS